MSLDYDKNPFNIGMFYQLKVSSNDTHIQEFLFRSPRPCSPHGSTSLRLGGWAGGRGGGGESLHNGSVRSEDQHDNDPTGLRPARTEIMRVRS